MAKVLNNYDVLIALRKVVHVTEQHVRRPLKELGITWPQYVTLKAVAETNGALMVTELANEVQLTPSTIVSIVDNLVEKGCINKERETYNRRKALISITDEGRELLKNVEKEKPFDLGEIIDEICEEDKEQIKDALDRLINLISHRP